MPHLDDGVLTPETFGEQGYKLPVKVFLTGADRLLKRAKRLVKPLYIRVENPIRFIGTVKYHKEKIT